MANIIISLPPDHCVGRVGSGRRDADEEIVDRVYHRQMRQRTRAQHMHDLSFTRARSVGDIGSLKGHRDSYAHAVNSGFRILGG